MKDNRGEIMYYEAKLIAFYEAYRQAIADFVEATGFRIELEQSVCSTEADAKYRDFIVGELTKIDEKYNK